MIIQNRKTREGVKLTLSCGSEIIIRVIETRSGKVRLGFELPPGVNLTRLEAEPAPPRIPELAK